MTSPSVIAVEEHFWSPNLRDLHAGRQSVGSAAVAERLGDLGMLRIREMDEAGIDLQVISETAPAAQNLEPDAAVLLARRSNDLLHAAIQEHPDRFAGFAALPTSAPSAAAAELERTVTRLRFKGAMISGLTGGAFLDEKRFWPIFERASALDVPLYIHPAWPHAAVRDVYYRPFAALSGAALGFTVEALTQAVRLVTSGVLDEFPRLKIILGHLGEALPFLLWRIDNACRRQMNLPNEFASYVRRHFYVTTSGAFSNAALACTIAELGIDRIMFAVDWPYQPNAAARQFMVAAPIGDADRRRILAGNARALLRL